MLDKTKDTANDALKSTMRLRSRGRAKTNVNSSQCLPSCTNSVRHRSGKTQKADADRGASTASLQSIAGMKPPPIDDQAPVPNQAELVVSDGSHYGSDNHRAASSTIATIREAYRRRQAWHRAEKSLTIQCSAICRRFTGIAGESAQALAKQVKMAQEILKRIENGDSNETEFPAALACAPLLTARNGIRSQREELDNTLFKMAESLPIATWVKTVRGFGMLNLAKIIGETANYEPETGRLRCIGDYKSVSALWKRMGLAVIDGERQQRKTGPLGIAHAFNPERRSVVWNLADTMIKANKKEGDPYRASYEKEKARQLAAGLTKAHAHNRAARYMTKEALKHLWIEWRKR